MITDYSLIEEEVLRILKDFGIKKLPIPIRKLARKLGLRINVHDLGEGISGVLVINNGIGTIGINESESEVRRRFTIAHELGHFLLHRKNHDLFIDKQTVLFRNEESSKGDKIIERAANVFAANILIPRNLLVKEIKDRKLIILDEDNVKKLAKTFNVSQIAMTYRLTNLFDF